MSDKSAHKPLPETIKDHETLKLATMAMEKSPTKENFLTLFEEIMGNPEPIPAQVFDLISPAGRAGALLSWAQWHMECPTADPNRFEIPGSGREW